MNDILNSGELMRAAELISPDFTDHGPAVFGQPPGPEGFRTVNEMFRGAFPDLTLTIDDLVAEGDKVAARCTARGTHEGTFTGIPPTGNQVAWEVISPIRIADGKITERWSQADTAGLMGQLKAPGSAGAS